ncbi:MAG: hypothetical protein AAFR87_17590 [Bacteroidota bacterium]
MDQTRFPLKQFLLVMLLVSLWVHVSEVFRYFVLVMPRMKAYWEGIPGIAEMNLGIFSIWGVWDTLLTGLVVFMFWIYSKVFGKKAYAIINSATLAWLFSFVIFWVAAANMGYTDWSLLWITLPLSWLELVVANWMASRLFERFSAKQAYA